MAPLYFASKYIAGVYRQSKLEINSQFAQFGVGPTEGDILLFIHDNAGISQRDVASKMVLDSGIVTRHMRSLEEKGQVTQQVDPADARRRVIDLTPTGQKTVQGLQKVLSKWWQNLFAAADIDDPDKTQADMEKLYQVIILQQR